MELTLERTKELHRELWNRIADDAESKISSERKPLLEYVYNMKDRMCNEILMENDINKEIRHSCFCCEYMRNISNGDECKEGYCPIKWSEDIPYACEELTDSLYMKTVRSETYADIAKNAREFANIEFKESMIV